MAPDLALQRLARWARRLGRRHPAAARGYARILVPVVDNAASANAVDVACRLAAERNVSILAVTVVEIPPQLPLDAHMIDEEEDARRILNRAEAIGALYGIGVAEQMLRAREAASAITAQAKALEAEIVVIGGERKSRRGGHAPVFGRTIQEVLKKAPCRVMVIAAPSSPAENASSQALATTVNSSDD